ncbi:MAG: Electron-transferring-flavoprotein dehydrogenase [Deltaproteobacteria bacterium]|nr:Electron-transferring-flavoprotein dehydrogenase [Deltaproteobacteria bacterium]
MTVERQTMEVDIACVGFGPAMGGFLTTLSRALIDENGMPLLESGVMPGMPLQVLCYERADDISFGVSGVVTRARSIRSSFPGLDPAAIPMASPVSEEKVLYLLDPLKASRRSFGIRAVDALLGPFSGSNHAFELPYIPPFLHKQDGLVLSIGQFNQWVGNDLMASGLVQIWPGMPVSAPLLEGDRVVGIRMADQGTNRDGSPAAGFMPGMDIRAALTVVADGPVGPVGQALDRHFGLPGNNHQREWAVGMKAVVELPDSCTLKPGTVLHTIGFPEPEIFGFLYVWDGYARIGEGSGSTNVLTGSGVDEAWETGVQLAAGVVELVQQGRPFTGANLDAAYLSRRRSSWVEKEAEQAKHARNGFQKGVLTGLIGMGLTGLSGGRLHFGGETARPYERVPSLEDYCAGKIAPENIAELRKAAIAKGEPLADPVMDGLGWPRIALDGKLLISHQDALLMGGKVQAPAGFADHVVTVDPQVCAGCYPQLCVEICSAQAITPSEGGGAPQFDREKCVHCGACQWNCSRPRQGDPERTNIDFRGGAGGLHSAEN